MASDVIKEFLVSIGYKIDDSSRRQVETAMKKLEKDIVDSEKRKEEVLKKNDQLRKDRVRQAVLEARLLGDAMESMARRVLDSMTSSATGFESLYYASRRIGMSVGGIKSFTFAVGQMGGSFEGALGSLESLASKIRRNPGYIGLMRSLGVQVGPNGELTEANMNQLFANLRRKPRYLAFAYGDLLGIDDYTMQAGLDNLGKWSGLYKEKLKKAGFDPDSAAKVAVDFNNSFRSLMMSVEILWDRIMVALMKRPTGGGKNLFEWLTDAVDNLSATLKDKTFGDIFQMIVDQATIFAKKVDEITDNFRIIAQSAQSIAHFFGLAPVPDKLGPVKPQDFPKGPPHYWWDPFGLMGVPYADTPAPSTAAPKKPETPEQKAKLDKWLKEQGWYGGVKDFDPSLWLGYDVLKGPMQDLPLPPLEPGTGKRSSLEPNIVILSRNVYHLAQVIEKQILTDAQAADKPIGGDVSGTATGPTIGGFPIPGGSSTSPSGPSSTGGRGVGRASAAGIKGANDFADYFSKKYGVSRDVALGPAAWMLFESGGTFSPSILGPGGDLGIAQWVGKRKQQLLAMFGPNPTVEDEEKFMDWELAHSYPGLIDKLKALGTGPDAAAKALALWGEIYEGAGGTPRSRKGGGVGAEIAVHMPMLRLLQGIISGSTGTYPAANAHAPRSGTPGGTYPDWLSMQSRRELAEVNAPLVRDLLEVARRTGIHFQVEQGIRTWADAYRNAFITHRGVFMSEHLWRAAADLTGLTGGTINQFGAAYEQLQRERGLTGRWGARFRGLYDPYHFDQGAGYGRTHAPDPYGTHIGPMSLLRRHPQTRMAALGGGHRISSNTTINVTSNADPHQVASLVAAKQSRVHADLLRNLIVAAQ